MLEGQKSGRAAIVEYSYYDIAPIHYPDTQKDREFPDALKKLLPFALSRMRFNL